MRPSTPPRIVAITYDGAHLARRLGAAWPDATVWLPERFANASHESRVTSPESPAAGPESPAAGHESRVASHESRVLGREPGNPIDDPRLSPCEPRPDQVHAYTGSVMDVVAEGFRAGQSLIVIAALGIVVRAIAPLVVDKRSDPAVVAVDDAGRYAISVLSGHLGGGNALAAQVASVLGAEAVITTASEAKGFAPLDLIGAAEGWRMIATPEALRRVAAAAVNGAPIGALQSAGSRRWRGQLGRVWVQEFHTVEALARSGLPAVVITERAITDPAASDRWLVYHPPVLVTGVGCSRGASADEIATLIEESLAKHQLARDSLGALATIDAKRNETGLLELAQRWELPIRYFTAAALDEMGGPNPSEVVRRAMGTAGVCEPAARLAAGGGPLVIPKQKSARVAVAVACCRVMSEG